MNKAIGFPFTIVVIAGLVLLTSFNVTQAQIKADKIDKLVSTFAEYGKFNGSVLVADKGNVIYKKGFGLANMEWSIPNQPDTKHRLGSITKQFTAVLIMQLVEQGKLQLHVPVTTWLPDYPKKSGDIITIHHLLTHTSGIPNMTSFPGFIRDVSRNAYTNDRGYRYRVLPVAKGEFINPDDGASLVFDTRNRKAITMVLAGRLKFKKMI